MLKILREGQRWVTLFFILAVGGFGELKSHPLVWTFSGCCCCSGFGSR